MKRRGPRLLEGPRTVPSGIPNTVIRHLVVKYSHTYTRMCICSHKQCSLNNGRNNFLLHNQIKQRNVVKKNKNRKSEQR